MKKIWCIIESYPKYWPEKLALFFYITGIMIVSYFHEPWFDEAVSWDIARDTPIKDILFYVPHYEGHPQLWHLVLAPFAKLGAPYEITITLINLFFMGMAIMLLLRFAPFPRLVKLLLPFTYFFFYQHGVIARPYSMATLAFVLLALFYEKRNIYPGRFVLSLMFLCATTAYGIVFAGGITIAWLLELWNREPVSKFLPHFIKDKRFLWMLLLLFYALLIIYFISPNSSTNAWRAVTSKLHLNNLAVCMLYMFIIIWPDVLCTNALGEPTFLPDAHFLFLPMFQGIVLGILVLSLILYFSYKKKTLLLFIIPATLFAIFSSVVYISNHHIGMALLFLLFWLWCSCKRESRTTDVIWNYIRNTANEKYQMILKYFIITLLSYMMITSLYWTVFSCATEITEVYSAGRNEAAFIKENHLDQLNVWGHWTNMIDDNGQVVLYNANMDSIPYMLLPYFDENLFSNAPYGTDGKYVLHVIPAEDEFEKAVEQWKEKGYPDVLIGDIVLDEIYDPQELSGKDYIFVYYEWVGKIWKDNRQYWLSLIRVRRDLAEELGLQEVIPQ